MSSFDEQPDPNEKPWAAFWFGLAFILIMGAVVVGMAVIQ